MEWLNIKDFAIATGRSVPGIHLLIRKQDSRLETIRPGHEYLISQKSIVRLKVAKNGHAKKKSRKKAR